MPRLSIAEATVETLLRHGLDGSAPCPAYNDPLFDAFYHAGANNTEGRLRVIHPRHAQIKLPVRRASGGEGGAHRAAMGG
jgi:acetolactate synthase-1/2/3 large subunit